MKLIAQGAAVLALATGVSATPKAVSVLQDATAVTLCDPTELLNRTVLQRDCGHSAAEACPIIVAETMGNANVECGQTMKIKGMDSSGVLQSDRVIHGVVWGHSDAINGGNDPEFAIAAPALKALCPLPCFDSNNDVYTCPEHPSDCQAELLKPMVTVVGTEHVIVSPLSSTVSFVLNYDFTNATGPTIPPTAGDVTGVVVVPGLDVAAWEILAGDAIDCGTATDAYTEAEAHMSASCGGAHPQLPCPMGADEADETFGSCFDDAVDECLEVTFYTEGLTDAAGVFCTNGECGSSLVSKRFRLVKNTGPAGPVHLPLGAWGDFCPHTCVTDEAGESVVSGVCAAAGECVENAPDIPVTGNWEYSQLGSQAAKMHYVSHAVVDCAMGTTEEPGSSTEEGGTSGAQRQIVGGLTAFVVATGVVYNL